MQNKDFLPRKAILNVDYTPEYPAGTTGTVVSAGEPIISLDPDWIFTTDAGVELIIDEMAFDFVYDETHDYIYAEPADVILRVPPQPLPEKVDYDKTMQYARDLRQAFTDPIESPTDDVPPEPVAVLYVNNMRGSSWRFKAWETTVWLEKQPGGWSMRYYLKDWPVFDGQYWDYWLINQLAERYLSDVVE